MNLSPDQLIKISREFMRSIEKPIDENAISTSLYLGQGMYYVIFVFAIKVNFNTYKFIHIYIFYGDPKDKYQYFTITHDTIFFKNVYILNYQIFNTSCTDPPRLPNNEDFTIGLIAPYDHELKEWYKQLKENRAENEKSYQYMEKEEKNADMVSEKTITIKKLSQIYNLI
ncbi:MAG: hypothetical protein Harvfovirus14_27 [Harvfovirus sp.]|uniref:Uncharacterized protein n=1 Tax=Harvfovirus sp. TaxID=2487768 RepID=A0A3G5A1E1_9VIRU|nr:MAG: hypothetical protein Harvfovirus14_27 [Harvfovirus sp.]